MTTTEATLAAAGLDAEPAKLERLRRRMLNPWMLRAYFLKELPLAFAAGLRVKTFEPERCEVVVPYGWRTQNPFRSIYFAAQSMAAELSTGALAMLAVEAAPAPVAMLIVNLEAEFIKKANALTTFTCNDGDQILAAVRQAIESGEPATVTAETVGRMPDGTEVSRFRFTWSFKKRRPRS